MAITQDTVKKFLELRQELTHREWIELDKLVTMRLREKAEELKLNDFDVQVLAERSKNIKQIDPKPGEVLI
ncbi:hypothetical protein [Streptococcus suis]